MQVDPSQILPSQDFLKEKTIRLIAVRLYRHEPVDAVVARSATDGLPKLFRVSTRGPLDDTVYGYVDHQVYE